MRRARPAIRSAAWIASVVLAAASARADDGAADASPTAAGNAVHARPAKKGSRPPPKPVADVILPGFEMLGDGSTRLFVELSRPVETETKTARRAVTVVLKGARAVKRNNMNPLVTVDFNTPVTSARLVPRGGDLLLVIALRADVQPAVSVDPGKEGGAMLHVEFPKGDYGPPPAKSDSDEAAGPSDPPGAPNEASGASGSSASGSNRGSSGRRGSRRR